jgi:hypothetical protein
MNAIPPVQGLTFGEKAKAWWKEKWKLIRSGFSVAALSALISNADRIYNWVKSDAPNLRTHAGPMHVSEQAGSTISVFCNMEVVNTGSDSSIRDFRLEIWPPGKTSPIKGIFLTDPPSTVTVKYRGQDIAIKDWLAEKSSSNPVRKGGRSVGYVPFLVLSNNLDTIAVVGTVYRVLLRDVNDKEIPCDYQVEESRLHDSGRTGK